MRVLSCLLLVGTALTFTACGTLGTPAAGEAPATLQSEALRSSGHLDPSYGAAGLWTSDAGAFENVQGLAVQQDGKALLLVGHGGRRNDLLSLYRLQTNGRPDPRFGQQGLTIEGTREGALALVCFGGANAYNDWGAACQDPERLLVAAVQPDGLTLYRYLPDGQPDPSFGVAGVRTTAIQLDSVRALAVQADGKLLIAGEVYPLTEGGNTETQTVLLRLTRSGAPDPSFGLGGRVTLPQGTDFVGLALPESEHPVLLTAGSTVLDPAALWRFTDTGAPDAAFGTAGRVPLDYTPEALLALPGRRLLVAGDGGLWRYRPGGALDPGFGTGGHAAYPDSDAGGFDFTWLAQDDQGRVVASVVSQDRFRPTFQGNLARFRPGGALDSSFGAGGVASLPLCPDCTSGLAAFGRVAVLRSGKLLAAGTRGRENEALLARVLP